MKTTILLALGLLITPLAHASSKADWSSTIQQAKPAIVSIVINAPRAFDTNWNFTGEATGFVVDAKRGIILTNRHVVQAGPVIATAIFKNNEEVPLTPIYRDPVHDFGLFHYDPDKLQYIHPQAMQLAPDEARVGEAIRVIGNDAGEQYSILASTLARLDRNAPKYGKNNYNDFNTFYFQADSGASGGSSGSPVINKRGHVVAMNAGGRSHTSSSYFLPLDRVVVALHDIQAGKQPPRGTLQTIFRHLAYNQLRRLGLSADAAGKLRQASPNANGLLVVSQVIQDGPAAGKLRVGDILSAINNQHVTGFNALADALDAHAGNTIRLDLLRGGAPVSVTLPVENLYAISPNSYLAFSGAVLNNLSYQMARNMDQPVSGVFVADPGFVFSNAGIGRGAVLARLGGAPTPDLDAFEHQLTTYANGAHVSVRYYLPANPGQPKTGLLRMDRHWFPSRRCHRNTPVWSCTALPPAKTAPPPETVTAKYPKYHDSRKAKLERSLVYVRFNMPYRVAGVQATHYVGTGLIVDADRGLVMVDRNTVPVSMGDLRLTFAGSVTIPANVSYISPLHNLAVIKYDPSLLGDTPVTSARFGDGNLHPGDAAWVIGFNENRRLVSRATSIIAHKALQLPLSTSLRFRDHNLKTWRVADAPDGIEGVLADAHGRVVALWSSFAWRSGRKLTQSTMGVPLWLLKSVISRVRDTAQPAVRTLGVEFRLLSIARARRRGLPKQWAARLSGSDNPERQTLMINRIAARGPADDKLSVGDLLLAIDDQPVHDFKQLYALSQQSKVKLTLLRDGDVMRLTLKPARLKTAALNRVLVWGGALLQRPPRALAIQRSQPRTGVWVAYYNYGSPASRYGLSPGLRITGVNGTPTPNISAFRQAANEARNNDQTLRLETVDANGRAGLVAMKLRPHYWPTYELVRVDGAWVRRGPRKASAP